MNFPQGPYDDHIYKGLIAFFVLLLASIPIGFVIWHVFGWISTHSWEAFFAMCVAGFLINERKRFMK